MLTGFARRENIAQGTSWEGLLVGLFETKHKQGPGGKWAAQAQPTKQTQICLQNKKTYNSAKLN